MHHKGKRLFYNNNLSGRKEVHVACIVSKPLVSCLWPCGESVNPPKLNIQEVQGALSSRPKGDPGPLPIFQDFLLLLFYVRPKKVSSFWSLCMSPQTNVLAFLMFFFLCYESMSNCSQNCWIYWNSAVLCFKRLFHIGVWTFARFERPLSITILCICEIWSLRIQCITYFPVGKKKMAKENCITAPILKPTDDQKLETFLVGLI